MINNTLDIPLIIIKLILKIFFTQGQSIHYTINLMLGIQIIGVNNQLLQEMRSRSQTKKKHKKDKKVKKESQSHEKGKKKHRHKQKKSHSRDSFSNSQQREEERQRNKLFDLKRKEEAQKREREQQIKKQEILKRIDFYQRQQQEKQRQRIKEIKKQDLRREQMRKQRQRRQDFKREGTKQSQSKPEQFQARVKPMFQEQRQRKLAMRKVRARLLGLNDLLKGSSQDSDSDPPPQPKPSLPVVAPKPQKRESKWNKTTSADSLIAPTPTLLPQEDKLKLQIQPSQDLRLIQDRSEDKSVDIQQVSHLQRVQTVQIDPLDEFMEGIAKDATVQMQLPNRKNDVITFAEIVSNDYVRGVGEVESEQFKSNFLKAMKSMEEKKQDQQGTVMEMNDEDSKSDISQFEENKAPTELDFFAKQRKMAERKELGVIDHSKVNYEEVVFNLYRQAEEVKAYDSKEVIKYRKEAGDIKVRGRDILNPIFNWYYCGFSDRVLTIIENRSYTKPFPIQAQAMPMLMAGRDVIGIAETGSGKTLAYLLPVLKHILAQRRVEEGQGPISLIMTPTRELARQVYVQAKAFCRYLGVRVLAVYGGASMQNQLSQFRKGVQLVICTPGRMIDILTLNKGKITNLKRVTFLVIDQADRMFDLGFQPQITRIIDNIRPRRQIALFSATFPKNVQILARKILTRPAQIIVGSRGQACANVQQIVQLREQTSKLWRLLQILGVWGERGSILIFVDKQTEGDYLFQELLKYSYEALVLHGAMDPDDRQFTIYDFKKGVRNIMIATSVCARGLDIRSIVLVVNFKCPNHLEDYIHRIGRTGRGGNKGTAITFITPQQEQYSIDLLKALEMAQITPPEELVKLSQGYLAKVKKGQAFRKRNRNIEGVGFKFDQEEEEKNNDIKDMIRKQMKSQGLSLNDSDDEDIELRKNKEEVIRNRNQQDRIAEAIKNPEIKTKLLNEAVKAVSQAMRDGSALTTEKVLQIAVASMRESVTKYKSVKTADDGVEQVTKLINQYQSKTAEGADFFCYDFEINDYPQGARQKACNQQFMKTIQHQTNCSISLRGVYVDPGKKAPVGCRKLYLHIQGENKYYVHEAFKEIKRVLEETAYQSMHLAIMPAKYAHI